MAVMSLMVDHPGYSLLKGIVINVDIAFSLVEGFRNKGGQP